MESLANLSYRHFSHIPLTLRHRRPSLSKPISSLSFTNPPSPKLSSLRPASFRVPVNKVSLFDSTNPEKIKPLPSLLKTTLVAAVAAAALFVSQFNLRPASAAFAVNVASPPPAMEESETEATSPETKSEPEADPEAEIRLEKRLASNPNDVQSIKTLMDLKMKSRKLTEALVLLDKLLVLEPKNSEWPVLKAYLLSYSGDHTSAKEAFKAIILEDPFRVEAYHGLVMVASQLESPQDLVEVEKMVLEGIEKSKKAKRKEGREFYVLLAQILVIRGDYEEALEIYGDLIRFEPRDFRPYLCRGIIYTLLKKDDEAEENYQKYRKLVPKGHPYAEYFDDNVNAAKLFAQKEANEKAYSSFLSRGSAK